MDRTALLRQNPLAPKAVVGQHFNKAQSQGLEIRATYEIRIGAEDYFSKAPTWYLLAMQDLVSKELSKRPDAKR